MHDVFLCHSDKDHDQVRGLYQDLTDLGFKVWFDEVSLKPGDSLIRGIGEGIRSAMTFAPVISPRSVTSAWVQKEISEAINGELSGARTKVVPIVLEKTDLPPFLKDVVYVDWTNAERRMIEFARLVKLLLTRGALGATPVENISHTGAPSATCQYSSRRGEFGPATVLRFCDEHAQGARGDYWLTPDGETGELRVQLRREYAIQLVRLLNTCNRGHLDRGTSQATLFFEDAQGGRTRVWRGILPPYPEWLNLICEGLPAHALIFQINAYIGLGGGLNCIEAYADI